MTRRPPRSTLSPPRRSSDLRLPRCPTHRAPSSRRLRPSRSTPPPTPVLAPTRSTTRIRCSRCIRGRMIRRSEEHTSELQSQSNLVCRLLLEKKKHTPSLATPGGPRQRRQPLRLFSDTCPVFLHLRFAASDRIRSTVMQPWLRALEFWIPISH